MSVSPEQVLAEALTALEPGAYLTAAVVIVEYRVPGADDEADRGPFMAWRVDTGSGVWTHLGMLALTSQELTRMSEDDER